MIVILKELVGNTFQSILYLIFPDLNQEKKFDLYNQGITTLDQVDLSQTKLSENQILQDRI